MKQKYSLAQLTVLNTSPVEIAKIAANTGYDYVSMRQIYMGLPGEPDYDLSKNPMMKKEVKQILQDTGLKLLDIELARIFDDMDVKKYEAAMETAVDLGGTHVLSSVWTKDTEYALEKFGQLCDLAKDYGLKVQLEFVPIAAINNLADTVSFLEQVNKDNAGIMIDVHHFHRSQDTIEDLKKVPRKWFHFAHLCDAVGEIPADREEMTRILREERLYVGEGGIDVKSILRAMPAMPYSIELPNLKKVAEYGYEEHAKRCLETAKQELADLW